MYEGDMILSMINPELVPDGLDRMCKKLLKFLKDKYGDDMLGMSINLVAQIGAEYRRKLITNILTVLNDNHMRFLVVMMFFTFVDDFANLLFETEKFPEPEKAMVWRERTLRIYCENYLDGAVHFSHYQTTANKIANSYIKTCGIPFHLAERSESCQIEEEKQKQNTNRFLTYHHTTI